MSDKEDNSQTITHHIFTVSATMIAVCLTIITIFKVTNVDLMTMADDVLGLDAFIFIISCFMSYISLRHRNNKTLELIADISFFIGMIIMVIAGAMVIFLTC
jgi:DMSO/TMAO reductase YedYZ heme-binding membrane subunit